MIEKDENLFIHYYTYTHIVLSAGVNRSDVPLLDQRQVLTMTDLEGRKGPGRMKTELSNQH